MKKIFKNNFFTLLFFLVVSFLLYWRLKDHFYEQDEWWGLGLIFSKGISSVCRNGLINCFLFGSGRPVAALINYIFYSQFAFNIVPIAFTSIILHGVVAYLIYLFLGEINKNRLTNFFAALFFIVNSSSTQAVSWFSSQAVLLSTLFFLLTLIFYFRFLSREGKKYLLFSYVTYYLSFITKEMIIMFSFLMIYLYYHFRDKDLKKNFVVNLPFISISLFAFLRYLLNYFIKSEQIGNIINSSSVGVLGILFNFIKIPLLSFVQIIISQEQMFWLSKKLSLFIFNVDKGDLFLQSTFSTVLVVLFSTILLLVAIKLLVKNKILIKNLVIGILIYILGVLPYAVIVQRGTSYLESRYYYLSTIGLSVVFVSIAWGKIVEDKRFKKMLCIFLFCLYTVWQITFIEKNINTKLGMSSVRKIIVSQLDSIDLKRSKKNVFFIDSDISFFGQKLPFQQGIGHMLMVIFYKQGVIAEEMLSSKKLLQINSQGYLEYEDYLFGYYEDENLLKKDLDEKHFSVNDLKALKWDENDLKFIDISDKIASSINNE